MVHSLEEEQRKQGKALKCPWRILQARTRFGAQFAQTLIKLASWR